MTSRKEKVAEVQLHSLDGTRIGYTAVHVDDTLKMTQREYELYNTRTRTVIGITLLTEDEAEFINRKCEAAGSDIRLLRLDVTSNHASER